MTSSRLVDQSPEERRCGFIASMEKSQIDLARISLYAAYYALYEFGSRARICMAMVFDFTPDFTTLYLQVWPVLLLAELSWRCRQLPSFPPGSRLSARASL